MTEVATDVVQRGTARLVAMKTLSEVGPPEGVWSRNAADGPCRPLWRQHTRPTRFNEGPSAWLLKNRPLQTVGNICRQLICAKGNLPMNTVVHLRPSQSEKPTVRGGRAKNADYRQREYLTEGEIDSLLATAGNSRNPVRDRLLILMAFRHALRVSELVDIR